jgi:hypothetical protein
VTLERDRERARLGVAAAAASVIIHIVVFPFLQDLSPLFSAWLIAAAAVFAVAAWRFHLGRGRIAGLAAIVAGLPLLFLSVVAIGTAPIGLALALGVVSATRAAWRRR